MTLAQQLLMSLGLTLQKRGGACLKAARITLPYFLCLFSHIALVPLTVTYVWELLLSSLPVLTL